MTGGETSAEIETLDRTIRQQVEKAADAAAAAQQNPTDVAPVAPAPETGKIQPGDILRTIRKLGGPPPEQP